VTLPAELAKLLDPKGRQLEARVQQAVVLQLIHEDVISSGKGAELLGISKDEMRSMMSEHGIPYFRLSPEELAAEVDAAEALRSDTGR
jgi:predicted HTH domain antitoxin